MASWIFDPKNARELSESAPRTQGPEASRTRVPAGSGLSLEGEVAPRAASRFGSSGALHASIRQPTKVNDRSWLDVVDAVKAVGVGSRRRTT